MIFLIGIWSLGFGILPSFAYRPFAVEDADVAGNKVFQFETSIDYFKMKDNKTSGYFLFAPIYGISDDLELSVEVPYVINVTNQGLIAQGVGDINIVGKYHIPIPILNSNHAIKGLMKMDNGNYDNGIGSGDKDYSIFLASTDRYGSLTSHFQLGYTMVGKSKDINLKNLIICGIGWDYLYTDQLHLLVEYSFSRFSDFTDIEIPQTLMLGAIFEPLKKVVIDCAIRFGLSNTSPSWSFTSGTSLTL